VSLISSSVSSETFSLSSLFDFSVDISILSDFAKEEPSDGDETFEAAITLELAIDELFETEMAVVALMIGGGVVMTSA
jgi:hypothetical protein